MDVTDLSPLLDRLEGNVDDLEEVLEPLLGRPLSATTGKLPVLDKAKLHILITYALESLIFSYLRLHGVNAKDHPVFTELTRVKQYFEKVKALETEPTEPEKRNMTLDKQAAARFIKHGLAGNDKIDLERAEREAKEKALAAMKAAQLAKRGCKTAQEKETQKPSLATEQSSASHSPEDSGSDSDSEMDVDDDAVKTQVAQPSAKKESEKPKPKKNSKGHAKLGSDERKAKQKDRRKKKGLARKRQAEKKGNNAGEKNKKKAS